MAAERTRHRRGEGGKLREEILNAVNRLLDEWGSVERLTIRAVAAETGVAAPSIYMHFKDKTDLVWAALSDKYQQLAAQMRIADENADPNGPVDRLRAQVHAYCLFGLKNPGHYRLLYETRQPQADNDRVRHHPASVVSGSLRAAVTRCQQAGCPMSLPVDQLVQTLWSGMHGTLSLTHSLFDDESLEPIVLDIADGLIDSAVVGPGTEFVDRSREKDSSASRRLRTLLSGG